MSRRLPAALVGALTVFALIAASLAPSVAAAGRPSVTLDVNVDGTAATVVAEANRGPRQIDSCTYVVDDSAAASCGSATETTKKAARYTFTVTDLAVGSHAVTVTIDLNGNGSASGTATFEVANTEIDADGDGIPDATDNCPTIANSGQQDHYGSAKGDACEDTDGDGTLDVNEADICVSVDGVVILSPADSTATCFSEDSPGGGSNSAVANGVGAFAQAYGGFANTATAVGDGSNANANGGHGNTATAGTNASAAAYDGNDNTAVANGDGAIAAAFGGDHNSATASGDGTFASASAPAGCTVTNGTCT